MFDLYLLFDFGFLVWFERFGWPIWNANQNDFKFKKIWCSHNGIGFGIFRQNGNSARNVGFSTQWILHCWMHKNSWVWAVLQPFAIDSIYLIEKIYDLQALPKSGITVFGSQLHTHLRGVRVLTRHLRDGIEMPNLNGDDYYSHHYQEIRYLRHQTKVYPVTHGIFNFEMLQSNDEEIVVFIVWSSYRVVAMQCIHLSKYSSSLSCQGDALITTCYYDTRGYTNITLGGFSISDEMCVNYIQYYPATKLEVCKSSVSEKTLANYFYYMKR